MKLSEQAWHKVEKIVTAIKAHPFNQELALGTLAMEKFAYYIEQDSLYLQSFARCHALVAAKISVEYMPDFLHYAQSAIMTEQEVVHHFFRKTHHFKTTGLMSPATLSYTSYLLRLCALEPVEVAIAGLLPCFWVYRTIGCHIIETASKHNPFARWIETYASDEFALAVTNAIAIFDAVAKRASTAIQEQMLTAFYTSTCLEWHFWNDAYHQADFDNMIKNCSDTGSLFTVW